MNAGSTNQPIWRRAADVDGPWLWLVYLPLYGLPWFRAPPESATLVASAIGIGLFLPVYIRGSSLGGRRLALAAAAVLLIALLLGPWGGNWTVIAIYASAMAARVRPVRMARLMLGGFALLTIAAGIVMGQPWWLWLMGVVFGLMVGIGTMAREAMRDANAALLEAQDEVRRLGGIAERERIARDLHDVVGRTLTLIALKADLAGRLLPVDGARAADELTDIGAAARNGLAEVRATLSGIAGTSLAREMEASRHALAAAGIAVAFEGDAGAVLDGSAAILAMTLREAVTNVIRHADASNCHVVLQLGPGEARLLVSDDGVGRGFREGQGLTGMRQRLAAAGGRLKLTQGSDGTRLEAAVPAGAR